MSGNRNGRKNGFPAWAVVAGIVTLFFALLLGCVSAPPAVVPPQAAPQTAAQRPSSISAEALGIYRTPEAMRKPPTDEELQVIDSAKTLLGQPPSSQVLVNGRKFTLDCIGTVSAIFYRLHIDVTKDFAKYTGTGVDRLFMSLREKGVLHTDKYPRPGDVVIWDNTWDANGDRDRTDDLRTHAGIVLAVDDDGTIHYIHENLHTGVVIEVMNLLHSDVYTDSSGKMLNSPLAIATTTGGPRPEHWVAGDLFDRFGDVLRVKNLYKVAEADWEDGEPQVLAMAQVLTW
jgi:cell wall-associated NlpC family hydrolase